MKKKNPDILLIMAVLVISIAVIYIAWCWAAKIIWGIEPPEGTSITAVAVVIGQLLAGGGIQIFKKYSNKELAAEVKRLKRENAALTKQLNKAAAALGGEQMKIGD